MITVISGLPGAGKTLRAMQLALSEKSKGKRVFTLGIDGVDFKKTGFEDFPWPASEWDKHMPVGVGALLVIDEAQKNGFGGRGKNDPPPAWMMSLTEHRHSGVDLVLLTQDPRLLDPFVRRLVGKHIHLVRAMGFESAVMYEWDELHENPKNGRSDALRTRWHYPKDIYSLYKSAEVHTVQKRFPKRVFLFIGGIVLCIVLVVLVFHRWRPVAPSSSPPHGLPSVSTAASSASFSSSASSLSGDNNKSSHFVPRLQSPKEKQEDAQRFLEAQTPRVASQPWSAPIFDGLPVLAQPKLYCVIVEGKGCRCYTEQITRYNVPELTCIDVARNGQYNPFQQPLMGAGGLPGQPQDSQNAAAAQGQQPAGSSYVRGAPQAAEPPDAPPTAGTGRANPFEGKPRPDFYGDVRG